MTVFSVWLSVSMVWKTAETQSALRDSGHNQKVVVTDEPTIVGERI
jgi:hypothetical protein